MKSCVPISLIVFLVFPIQSKSEDLITLDEAYALALKNNPSIRLLQERVEQAKAEHLKAWAAIKPTASFQGSFTHYDQEILMDFAESMGGLVDYMATALRLTLPDPLPSMGESQAIEIQKQNQFGFNGMARLPLFVGPAYQGIGLAKKQLKLAQLTTVRSQQDFLLQVARAYYLVISQKELVRALNNKVDIDSQHLAAAKSRFEVGKDTRSSVLRADLVLTQDSQNLKVAQNSLQAAKRQLAILLGVHGLVDVNRPTEPILQTETKEQHMLDAALQQRLDYQATDLALKMAHQGKNAVWWGFAPTLDMQFLYRWSESTGFSGDHATWSLMFTANLPIYDGGLRYASLRESHSKIREATEQRRALAQLIESEIVQLRSELASAEGGVVSAQKAVKLAEVTVADMEASYEVGAVTQLDVLDSSQRKLESEIQLVSSLFKRDVARLSLSHSLGIFDPARR